MPSFLNPNQQNPHSEAQGSSPSSSSTTQSSFATSLSDFRLPASNSSGSSNSRTTYGFNSNSNQTTSPSIDGSEDGRGQRLIRRGSLLGVNSRDPERPVREKDRWKGNGRAQESDLGNVQDGGQNDAEMDEGDGNLDKGDTRHQEDQRSSSASNFTSTLKSRSFYQHRPRSAIPSFPFSQRSSSPSPRAAGHSFSNHSLSSFSDMRRPRSFSGSSDIGIDAMQVDPDEDISGEGKDRDRSSRNSTPPASSSNQNDQSNSSFSISSRRAPGRKSSSLLPRDKSVLRVAATLRDESKPEDSELASEAKLQRRLGELSLPTSPVARSASASSGFEKGAGMWGWGRASPFFEGGSSRSRRGASVVVDGDLDLAYGLGYGASEDGMIESDDSSDGLMENSPPPLPPSMLHPNDSSVQSNDRSSSVPPNLTQPQFINSFNQSHNQRHQLQSNVEEEIEMTDGNNSSTQIHPRSFGGGSSFPNSTSNFAPSTSAGRSSNLWTGFRDSRRSRTPGASVLTNGYSSANASPGAPSSDAMDVEGIVAGLERSVKRKYVSDERFEPYANSAKRRAVSPSLGLALRGSSTFSLNSPNRKEDASHSNGVPMASPSLLATTSYIHGSSPLHISTTSTANHALPIPTPLSIPSPTTPFANPPSTSVAATHYFSNQHLGHRRSSSATSLKDITSNAFNPTYESSTLR